jgi:hypothetical protein
MNHHDDSLADAIHASYPHPKDPEESALVEQVIAQFQRLRSQVRAVAFLSGIALGLALAVVMGWGLTR